MVAWEQEGGKAMSDTTAEAAVRAGEQLLTGRELARRLGASDRCARRWARLGYLPCLQVSGRVRRYDLDEVFAALRRRGLAAAQEERP